MKILVTGAGGFVGRHLTTELAAHKYTITAFESHGVMLDSEIPVVHGDIRDADTVEKTVAEIRPDACIHLAGVSFVPDGAANPDLMLSVNVRGTINILDAMKKHAPACKTLVISTAHIYEGVSEQGALNEDTIPAPLSNYAVSKTAADLATLAYAKNFNIHAMTARPHNHIGPGQSTKFVIPSFIHQAKAIAAGTQDAVFEVGNLDCERDFSDVRDVVRAYRLLIEKGRRAQAYNISSNNQYKIGAILNMICDMAGIKPEIKTDPTRFRPTDKSPVLDTTKIQHDTGWHTNIELEKTLHDIMSQHNL